MERLTERNPSWIEDEFWTAASEPDDEEITDVYIKLKAYEDTGLEPKEIFTLCDMDRRSKMGDMLRLEEYQALGSVSEIRTLKEANQPRTEIDNAIKFFENALENCVMVARKPFETALDALRRTDRNNKTLAAALNAVTRMAEYIVCDGRVDEMLCDRIPEALHLKYQPKNDGDYDNGPCIQCVAEYFMREPREAEAALDGGGENAK